MDACLTDHFRWHSHSLSQRADGLFGAFVIHDFIATNPSQGGVGHSQDDLRIREEQSIFSERLLLVGDWYHRNSTTMLSWYRSKKSYGFVHCIYCPSSSCYLILILGTHPGHGAL